jgi:dihydroxyacetone kinase-like predicted kinase
MQEQYQEFILSKARVPLVPTEPLGGTGTVVVSPGPGLSQVFESLGASVVVAGGQTMNPSTEDLLTAIESIPGEDIIILPNNKNIIMASEQAGALSEKKVKVVRTISVPQGISSLLALNYQADLTTNAQVMAEAAESIETIEVTRAVRSVRINEIDVQEGEVIGLVNGKLRARGDSPSEVTTAALAQIGAENYEIVTLYYGDTVSNDQAQELAEEISVLYPDLEVEVVDGGQPHYYYILSAE